MSRFALSSSSVLQSSSPSSSATTATVLRLLSSLEAKRQSKRRQVESLFAQQQTLQRQMEALEQELCALDDEIDALQDETEEQQQQQHEQVSGQDTMQQQQQQQQQQQTPYCQEYDDDEVLTEAPPPSMTYPDELLSDPTTQLTQQQQQSPAAVSARPPRTSNAATAGRMGQLELELVNTTTTTATAGSTTNVASSTKKHAALPGGLQRTNNTTLDHYFGSSCSSSTASSTQQQQQQQSSRQSLATQVQHLLHHTFGLPSFRGHQEDIIHATLTGHDVFVIMRTGGGKSLTYQLPALLEGRGRQQEGPAGQYQNFALAARPSNNNKVTLVVSPLLSLIQDQQEQMNAYAPGSATSFHGNLSREEQTRRWELIRNPASGVCLVLVTPEKVHKSHKLRRELQTLFDSRRLGRFVIDEAHCCSNWGHDFRPDYTKLGMLKTHFPSIPMLAVTATASDRVREDVCQILRLGRDHRFFRSTARRPNLTYSVRRKTTLVVEEMASFIQQEHATDAGIIYTMTKKEADQVANKLCDLGIVAQSYHSSITPAQKERIHKSWMSGTTQVVVATIAFGLGINKPNVRFVLHHTLSKSLEAYYQESGRAGRDGGPADCVLYYSPKDVPRIIGMIHGDNGEHTFWSMARYAQASGSDAVCKGIILKALGEPNCPDIQVLLRDDNGVVTEEKDIGVHAKTVTALLHHKMQLGEDLTLAMLVKEWRSKNPPDCVKNNPPGKEFTEDECLRIVVSLILENVISPNVIWNSYGNTMYLKLGHNGKPFLAAERPSAMIRLPIKPPKAAKGTGSSKKKSAATKAKADDNGWIEPKKRKRKPAPQKKDAKAKKPKAKTKKKKQQAQRKADIIELLDDSSDEEEEPIMNSSGKVSWDSYDVAESDSECEFDD